MSKLVYRYGLFFLILSARLVKYFITDASTGGTDLISCANVTGSTADYCCDHTNDCCDTGVGRFQILPTNPSTSAIWIASATAFSVVRALSSTSSSDMASQTTGSSAIPSNTKSPSTGLSTGAKAGIGVGVSIAGLFIAGILFFYWRYRMSNRQTTGRAEGIGEQSEPYPIYAKQDLTSNAPQELATEYNERAELSEEHRHELHG
jgi:hypothetical protein